MACGGSKFSAVEVVDVGDATFNTLLKELKCVVDVISREVDGEQLPPEFKGKLKHYLSKLVDIAFKYEKSILALSRRVQELENAIVCFAMTRLTEKQRILLRHIALRYGNHNGNLTLTSLIDRLSSELKMSRSTVRWNLIGLRDAGLIKAGSRDNKGVPVKLTEAGLLVVSRLIKCGEWEPQPTVYSSPLREASSHHQPK